MKSQLVAAMFCPVVVRKEPQAKLKSVEASEDQALAEPAKPVKSKKRKGSGEGKKPKRSKQQTNEPV